MIIHIIITYVLYDYITLRHSKIKITNQIEATSGLALYFGKQNFFIAFDQNYSREVV